MSAGRVILNKIVVCQFASLRLVLLSFHVTFTEKKKKKLFLKVHNLTFKWCFPSCDATEKLSFMSWSVNNIEINIFFFCCQRLVFSATNTVAALTHPAIQW